MPNINPINQGNLSLLLSSKALLCSFLSIFVFQFASAHVRFLEPEAVDFQKSDDANPTLIENEDRITENIEITKARTTYTFNSFFEDGFNDGDQFSLTCSDDITIQLSEDDVETIIVNYPMPTLGELCDTELVLDENLFLTSGQLPGTGFPIGITPVYYEFNDGEVSETCNFFVTVLPYYGCTNPEADNYNSDAIQDDGSCFILDCPGYSGAEVVTFEKENYADWLLEENQDRVADNVWLTRQNNQGLFNVFDQTGYSGGVGGPSNTEWRLGTTDDTGPYTTWVSAALNNPADNCNFNSEMAFKISDTDTYFDVTWHSFSGSNSGGGFYYTRTLNIELSGCTTSTPLGCTDETACNYDPDAFYDDGSCIDAFIYFADSDMDGFGDAETFVQTCEIEIPNGYVLNNTDCDDGNNLVYPGAPGTAQGIDNDCNDVVEEDEISCDGDFDGDGVVNAADLLGFLSSFGCVLDCNPYDLSNDGVVNAADLLAFLSVFGNSCE